jgi:hypothetical protein
MSSAENPSGTAPEILDGIDNKSHRALLERLLAGAALILALTGCEGKDSNSIDGPYSKASPNVLTIKLDCNNQPSGKNEADIYGEKFVVTAESQESYVTVAREKRKNGQIDDSYLATEGSVSPNQRLYNLAPYAEGENVPVTGLFVVKAASWGAKIICKAANSQPMQGQHQIVIQ